MSEPLLTLTIDGRTVQVPKGTLLVEAAKRVGVEIPVFCYHPKLEPAGVCRMCLVQVEKIPKPQTACTTLVAEGMVVHTQNETVAELQKGVLEFLLINHPLDCPVCDKGGECDLQDLTYKHGPSTSRLQDGKVRKDKSVDLGNFIVLDNERCILCRRCTRFDDEIAAEGNLIIEERGHYNTVTTMEGERYDSYFSGNTIELCPVGALTSELYRFKARPWDLSKVDSICSGCSVGCNTKEEFRHGSLLRITSRDNAAVDNGWLCDRGRFNYRYVQGEERITQPLVKRDGEFVPVSWQEAFEVITERFKAAVKSGGPKALGVIGGGRLTNEEGYLLGKFARTVLGTNNVDHRVSDQVIASLASFPGRQTDLSDAGAILILDTDPAETAPVMDLRIRRMADRKKAKIAVVGSVMPSYRGRHARIRTLPGQTAGVLAALAAAAAGKKPLPSAADPEAIKRLIDLLSGATKVAVVWSGNDAALGRALADLAGALKKPATGGNPGRTIHVLIPGAQNNSRGAEAMGLLPGYLPGYGSVSDANARTAVGQIWRTRKLSAEPGLDTAAMLKAAAEGELQALYLAGANLINTFPDRKLAQTALDNAFVVVADLFLNETARTADVILPAAAIAEKKGTYTTLDGLVQPIRHSKSREGQAQPDGDILVALAQFMGAKLAASPGETSGEIARLVAVLEEGTVLAGAPLSLLPAVVDAAVADGPAVTGAAQALTAIPVGTPGGAPEERAPESLLLVPVTRLYAGGSTAMFDEHFRHVLPTPVALFHPTDAARLGLSTGDQVELKAGDAAVALTARTDGRVVPGTVQAIKGLPAAPIGSLTAAGSGVAVSVAKLAVEVAH